MPPVSSTNYIVMENLDKNNENLIVKNLVIFPGVVAKFSDSTINVEDNIVVLGKLNFVRSGIKTKNYFNGFSGSLRELQNMIGLTGDQVVELIERLNNK